MTRNRVASAGGTRRSNVLCLGMSYANIKEQLDNEGVSWSNVIIKEPGVEQTVELVRRNVLTEMDGRDLARCQSMEDTFNVKAHTVSQECGALYAANHLHGNFNRPNFLREIKRAWGRNTKFKQIILDYFWIPQGTWMMNHWSRSFFHTTLPGFVKEALLEFDNNDEEQRRENNTDICTSKLGVGVLYLPFCFHCVKQIVSCLDTLSKYYTISFVYSWELQEHALWAATSKICPTTMQEWLGKQINQEDVYCTFTQRDVKECIEDEHVTKDEVVRVLERIEDFGDVRMIRLKPLSKHNPNRHKTRSSRLQQQVPKNTLGVDVGGFVGLKEPKDVRRGYYDLDSDGTPEASEDESQEEEDDLKNSPCSQKARKKRISLGVVQSSPSCEPRPISTDEESSSSDDDDDYMKGEAVELSISLKNGARKKIKMMNLCPELHPIEPNYVPAELDTDTPLHTCADSPPGLLTPVEVKHQHVGGFDLILEAAEIIRGTSGACTVGAMCEQIEGTLYVDENTESNNVAFRKSSCKKVEGLFYKGTMTGRNNIGSDRSGSKDDSKLKVGDNPVAETDSCEKKIKKMNDAIAHTNTVTRNSCEQKGSRTTKVAPLESWIEASQSKHLPQVPNKGQVTDSKRLGDASHDYSLEHDSVSLGHARSAFVRVERAKAIGERHDASSTTPLRLRMQIAQRGHTPDLQAPLRCYERQFVSPVPSSLSDIFLSSGTGGHSHETDYKRMPLPFKKRILQSMLLPNPFSPHLDSCIVTVSLADECYSDTMLCTDVLMQSSVSPDMSIAQLTRFFVEELNPMKWLCRICRRSNPFQTVPSIVRISYGGESVTSVRVLNSSSQTIGEISVGLRTKPGSKILSPFDSALVHLHPCENYLQRLELVTDCVHWENSCRPDKSIDVTLRDCPFGASPE